MQRKRKEAAKTAETLHQYRALDPSPRNIGSRDIVEFICSCGNTGKKQWSEADKSFKRKGFAYQCPACLKAKYANRGEEWLAGIRAAARTPEHKARAAQNGKKRLMMKKLGDIKEFWNFGDQDVQGVAGATELSAKCRKCDTVSSKALKKFIESQSHETHGCEACWEKYTKSVDYRRRMRSASSSFWSAEEAQKWRQRLSDRASSLRAAYDSWVVENPDKAFSSKAELEILSWVTQDLGLAARKHRDGGQEIDIYIPELKIGIEYNGLYWHSEARKDKLYHLNKTEHFKKQGIRVIHVFEHEWRDRGAQVRSFLRSALGCNKVRIGARKLIYREASYAEAKALLEITHIQGAPQSVDCAVGGYLGDRLVVLATFGKHHRDSSKTVLNRFVTAEDHTVSGALSKLTRMGVERFGKIVSWCDLRWSSGNGYIKAGWVAEEILKPDYFYTDFSLVYNKQSRMKSVVGTPGEMTEKEHAIADGLFRVYDCGKIRFSCS